MLSYWPLPGETIGETEVVAPRLTELLRLAGNADDGRFVQHIRLEGLSFQHSDWVLTPRATAARRRRWKCPPR